MERHFCTYFDKRYLSRGLLLYRSLAAQVPEFRLWVLCLDRPTHEYLEKASLPGLVTISLDELEEADAGLLRVKNTRTLVEYYFTCTPCLPVFILRKWKAVELITYLDADLWFSSSPEPLYEELGSGSIGIIGHRFPVHLEHLARAGTYNVGWLTFRRSDSALSCLDWWREQCLEWCGDRFENGKFADQKYLDAWSGKFAGVVVLENKGANLAPWNLGRYRIFWNGHQLLVDDQPLIFFHFHGLKQDGAFAYDLNLTGYQLRPDVLTLRRIYKPYVKRLVKESRSLGVPNEGPLRHGSPAEDSLLARVRSFFGPLCRPRELKSQQHLWVLGNHVFWI